MNTVVVSFCPFLHNKILAYWKYTVRRFSPCLVCSFLNSFILMRAIHRGWLRGSNYKRTQNTQQFSATPDKLLCTTALFDSVFILHCLIIYNESQLKTLFVCFSIYYVHFFSRKSQAWKQTSTTFVCQPNREMYQCPCSFGKWCFSAKSE